MATYVNDLRLKEIATGDEAGTWGTSTNTNLELIAEAFSFGTEAITTNADTHTTTIADGSTDPGRSLFLKYTGTLDSACTITIGPNTVSKLWLIENATSGSQNIIIKQGSGATVTVPNGQTKAIYSDGAGSGGAMVDAFQDLSIPDLFIDDDLTVGDDLTVTGLATIGETLAVTGVLTANAGVVVDNITIDGTEIDLSSGDLTLDVAGDIILDADSGVWRFKDAGTTVLQVARDSNSFLNLYSGISDMDMRFQGNDGGSTVTALTLDMSAAGAATFNDSVSIATIAYVGQSIVHIGDADTSIDFANNDIQFFAGGVRHIDLDGSIVFNENGADLDFRVESTGNASMLVVDAGNNVVNINGTTVQAGDTFAIHGSDTNTTMRMYNTNTGGDGSLLIFQKDSSSPADGDILGDIRFHGNDSAGVMTQYGRIRGFSTDVTNGTEDGQINLEATLNGTSRQRLKLDDTQAVFNEEAQDLDFRVESTGNANMFVVNAGANGVGIGTDNPGTRELKVNNASNQSDITITSGANQSAQLLFGDQDADNQGIIQYNNNGDTMHFFVDGAERFALDDGLTFEGKPGTSPIFEMINNDNEDNDTGRETTLRFSGHRSGGEDVVNAQISGHHAGSSDNDNGLMILSTNNGSGIDEKMRLNFDEIIINQNGNNQALRVESDNNANMIFVDAANDVVCIGGTTAESADHLEVLSSDSNTTLRIRNTNAGAAGPRLVFDKSSASQANDDVIGELLFIGKDSAGNAEQYAGFKVESGNVTSGGEDGVTTYAMMVDGAYRNMFTMNHVGTAFNDGGVNNLDFRVETGSNANGFIVDGQANAVFVGTNSTISAGSEGIELRADFGFAQFARNNTGNVGHILFYNPNGEVGSISTSSSSTLYNTSSDQRLKENIADADDAGELIDAIQVRQFNWKADGLHQSYGMIAQELNTVAPEAVSIPEDPDEMMSVDYSKLVPMLVKEIQSLRNRVAELEGE